MDREFLYKNRPIPVEFLGFKSDTYSLGRAGWRLAAYDNPPDMTVRFLFEHTHLRLMAICDKPYELGCSRQEWLNPSTDVGPRVLFINNVSSKRSDLIIRGEIDYREVDTLPKVVEKRITSIDDLRIFDPIDRGEATAYVDKADMSVVDHLQGILDAQADKQRELREKVRKAEDSSKAITSKIIRQIVEVDL